MDPRINPYAPGAGTPPPELAGRDEIIERTAIALDRIKVGRSAQSVVFYGLRGVGKTVLLNKIRKESEARGVWSVAIEAPEERSLPSVLGPALRSTLFQMDRSAALKAATKELIEKTKRVLASFIKASSIKYQDIEFNIEFEAENGVGDSGNLELDLSDLMISVGNVAKSLGTVVALFVDELQYVKEEQLASLITALHKANQEQLPITMVATGLPQLLGQTGRAKSYAERLFEFTKIGALSFEAAETALCVPASKENVMYERNAIKLILEHSAGYPYFIQEFGKKAWNIAQVSPISEDDARWAIEVALNDLDASFFRVRFDRLTQAEKNYMRAMASLGPGPHRSGDIAIKLGKKVVSVAPLRSNLIRKGMIYSPNHGDTAFTVPMFDGFMKRIMPDWN